MHTHAGQEASGVVQIWGEQVEAFGDRLTQRVKDLIQESSVRRLRIHTENNGFMLEMPLLAGVVVGAAATVYSPTLTMLAAAIGLLTRVRVEVADAVAAQGSGSETPESRREAAPAFQSEEGVTGRIGGNLGG